jgi:PKD repeat protein
MKKILFSIFLGAIAITAFAQTPKQCATDEVYQELLKQDPTLIERQNQFDADAAKIVATENIRKTGSIRIIPVVFHIFHSAGSENISDAQILDELRILNENFRNTNANAANTRPIFQGVMGDMEIEFRLARKDPQGNCTNGIVRVYEEETDNGTNNIKIKSVWPTDRYLNVWVVDNIVNLTSLVGIAGFAQFPWAGSYNTDGVIIRSDQIGSIGSSNPSNATTVTHEVGHWLGCFHPFQDSCAGGDRVDDTPPCANRNGILSCNYNRNTCIPNSPNEPDLPDQIENYMDYITGTCQTMFTIGQKARMDASLLNWRPLLTSQANLVATGTDVPNTPATCKPTADFFSIDNQRSRSRFACAGGSAIDFRDNSYNYSGGITREWIFEGGTPATSTIANPNVTYANPGKFDVTLIVSNANGTDTLFIDDYIEVIPAVAEAKAPYTQDFEFPQFPVDGWFTNSTTFTDYRITDVGIGTVLPNNSRTLQAPNGNGINGSRFDLFSPSIDLSGVSNPVLSFYYSFAQRLVGGQLTTDGLRVYYSTNCGQSWIQMWARAGSQLGTVGSSTPTSTLPFVPSDRSKWRQVVLGIPGNITATQRQNLRFRFQFISGGGNNFYIDAINFGFPSSVNNTFYNDAANFNVYPNPTNGNSNISVNLLGDSEVKVTVQDILGRNVATLADGKYAQGNQEFTFDASQYNANGGIYFIKLTVNDNVYTKKLIHVK